MVTGILGTEDVQRVKTGVDAAQAHVERLRRKIESLQAELDLTAIARDIGLYRLLCVCDALQREQVSLSEDATEDLEQALDFLSEHNLYTGLSEPDHAILRLMEVVTAVQEDSEAL